MGGEKTKTVLCELLGKLIVILYLFDYNQQVLIYTYIRLLCLCILPHACDNIFYNNVINLMI